MTLIQDAWASPALVAEAATWYDRNQVPPAFRDLHPLVLAHIARTTHNDWRRCIRNDDNSVDIMNARIW